MNICITIDCEEWNSPALGNERLLELFHKHNIKATFFITGYYAEHEPEDVKRIAQAGHEIACHGYEHHYRGREFDVEADVKRGKEALERISGVPVKGFRAPQAQYSQRLLQAVAQAGFVYDSSLHPAWLPGYYNHSSLPLGIHQPLSGAELKEIPVAVMPLTRLPIVWMFMRNMGVWYTQLGVSGLVKRGICPNLYFHSWEFTEMKSRNVPWYFTRRTGEPFLKMLEKFIVLNKEKGRAFVRLGKMV